MLVRASPPPRRPPSPNAQRVQGPWSRLAVVLAQTKGKGVFSGRGLTRAPRAACSLRAAPAASLLRLAPPAATARGQGAKRWAASADRCAASEPLAARRLLPPQLPPACRLLNLQGANGVFDHCSPVPLSSLRPWRAHKRALFVI